MTFAQQAASNRGPNALVEARENSNGGVGKVGVCHAVALKAII